ncbi:MAG: AI-2E family transporter [Lachnospiraceae bacterium]
MKYRWDKKYLYWGMTAFGVIIASICFYYVLFHGISLRNGLRTAAGIAMPIIDGLALAYLMCPIVNFVEDNLIFPLFKKAKFDINKKSKKIVRFVSIIITVFIVFTFIYGFFSMVIPQLITSIQNIIQQFPVYLDNLSQWLGTILSDNPNLEGIAIQLFNQYSGEVEHWLNQSFLPQLNGMLMSVSLSVLGFLKSVWNLILGFIIAIYLLSSKELFTGQCKKIIYAIFETKTANFFIQDIRFTHKTFSGFLGGKIIDSIIIGILCFICTNFIGTPYALLVSVIVGITNVIPFFGPYLGAIPSSILILMVDPLQCLYFIIFILILQQFDGNFLGPKILGNSTGMSAFWVIFSITIFGGLFGIFGMFIGVPTFAVLLAAFKAICNQQLRKKGLSTDTNKYLALDVMNGKEYVNLSSFSEKEEEPK